ncbi:kinase-like domain-containing protein [Limtongia smithiae]|uniref:kinase-like domain-containing protein n=1 Tax=Limtongia smithiae TaxID=1125753 RepID=UPI0034CFC1BB
MHASRGTNGNAGIDDDADDRADTWEEQEDSTHDDDDGDANAANAGGDDDDDDDGHTSTHVVARLTLGLGAMYEALRKVDARTVRETLVKPAPPTPGHNAASADEELILMHRYRVIRTLGAGAFATTFLAQDLFLSTPSRARYVAIKRLAREYNAIGVHEAGVLRSLRHKSVAAYFADYVASFYSRGSVHLVLECLDAGRQVRLPCCTHGGVGHVSVSCPARVHALAKVAVQLLSGLHGLHTLGWIHADLKPENLMYSHGAAGRVKIIDLGNAVNPSSLSAYFDDFDIQSVGYRAPEVLLGDRGFDARIDVWSVGVLLLELLLGENEENLLGRVGEDRTDGRIITGGTRAEVVAVVRRWFGSVDCYSTSGTLWAVATTAAPTPVRDAKPAEPQTPTTTTTHEDTQRRQSHAGSSGGSTHKRRRPADAAIIRDYVRRRRSKASEKKEKMPMPSPARSSVGVSPNTLHKEQVKVATESLQQHLSSPQLRFSSSSPPARAAKRDSTMKPIAPSPPPPPPSAPRALGMAQFLGRLLTIDYNKRPTAAEALRDQFLTGELLGTWGDVLLCGD